MRVDELKAGLRLAGVSASGPVEVVAVEQAGDAITLIYRDAEGRLDQRVVTSEQVEAFEVSSTQRWTFDADGKQFRLASEARRIHMAHLFDPFTAVESAGIEPLPHQIEAVYEQLLPMQPLSFVLADDPGAGKTIMAGLYIRELLLRGDLSRCLVVAPGSLVEQWQEELWDKFSLSFELMSRDAVEASRTGNPFIEKNFLIARVDQLARNDDLLAKLNVSDWDLVVVDEAHKMSARAYGSKVNKTKRYELGEMLRERARNLLLMTATPHNGKPEDFVLFMSLVDPERFEGTLRPNADVPDTTGVMRRYVKENLLTFEGKRLFPKREAVSAKYDLSPPEQRLYEQVTDYVRDGMNRAQALTEGGDRRRGLIVGFALAGLQRRLASSPEAIYQSLRRRRERLERQLQTLQSLADADGPIRAVDLPKGITLADLEDFDYDDYDDEELEDLENVLIDGATAAATARELEVEVAEIRLLEQAAEEVRASREDRKWNELANILQSDHFTGGQYPRKLIVFTEHKDTLNYLVERITSLLGRAEAVVAIHGGLKREDRRRIQDAFRNDPVVQVLVATDAAGEGVNLQRANLMVNYDLPWNPNRLEQRFGRIHRIGQEHPCFLWNLVAHTTREGKVFERLFEKIAEQRKVYDDQVYDILGDAQINRSLQELLMASIQKESEPEALNYLNEVVDGQISERLVELLEERALAAEVLAADHLAAIRDRMEIALSRKLQPGFIEAFAQASLAEFGGRMARREPGRYEVTRVPSTVRSREREARIGGAVLDRYERVTFDKNLISVGTDKPRAELVAPGHPLLGALIDTVLQDYGDVLTRGATLVDRTDDGETPRVLVYLEHAIRNGRPSPANVVSQRFQFVEVSPDGRVQDPGADPYLNYDPLSDIEASLLTATDHDWFSDSVESVARNWAIAHLAAPHFEEIEAVTTERVERVRHAVEQRLDREIRHWDAEAAEAKRKELQGEKPRRTSGTCRKNADELIARRDKRLRELEAEGDLANQPPTIVAAALVIPQGLLNRLAGIEPEDKEPVDTEEVDRRAVAAVMEAERRIGRIPEEQDHNNPGFDILSLDPVTGMRYFIEVKGHIETSPEVKVRARQVRQAKQNPERFRLAIVTVPIDETVEPTVHYFVRPFDDYELHFAQTYVPLTVAEMIPVAVEPM